MITHLMDVIIHLTFIFVFLFHHPVSDIVHLLWSRLDWKSRSDKAACVYTTTLTNYYSGLCRMIFNRHAMSFILERSTFNVDSFNASYT